MNFSRKPPQRATRFKLRLLYAEGLIIFALLALSPQQVTALSAEDSVSYTPGGRVVRLPNPMDCVADCLIPTSSPALLSFIAIQDKGYRFEGWTGDCANALSTICTINTKLKKSVNARFVKAEAPDATTKAILLLHDAEARPAIWNEFVKQQFDNRCPIIYGGVVLGKDSFNPGNHVYCYRIAFGYHDQLQRNRPTQALQQNTSTNPNNIEFASHEILAAMLGILNRHPQLSLALVGQQHAALAAQSFLQFDTTELSEFAGLLSLQQTDVAQPEPADAEWLPSQPMPMLRLEAKPQQGAKISTALSLLTKSWWLNP